MAEVLKKGRGKTGRRALAGIFSAVLAAGVLMLPASPAAAYTCKVNSLVEPTESDVQDLFDDASVATVTFYGACDGSWTIERSVSIVGSGTAESPALLGPDGDSIFHIHGPANVSISGALEFYDADDAFQGGGIYAEGATVTMTGNIYFSYGDAFEGGAIYLASGSLTYTAADTSKYLNPDGSLDWDVAEFWCNDTMSGGAIFVAGGTLTVTNADFAASECADSLYGGAVYVDGGSATFNNVRVIDNYAAYGAGMGVEGSGVLRVNGGYFESNNAYADGGAFYAVDGGSLTVASSTVVGSDYDSSGAYRGAGIFARAEGSVSVTGTTFLDLETGDDGGAWGGAIYHDGNNLKIDRSTFTNNSAPTYGGAIFAAEGSDTVVTNSTFTGNHAWDYSGPADGGAIAGLEMDLFTISGSTFTNNGFDPYETDGNDPEVTDGGAIAFLDEGSTPENVTISRSTFTGNRSADDAGAIYLNGVGAVISLSTFTRNDSDDNGGAIGAFGDDDLNDLTVQQSTFTSNWANGDDNGGGAVYSSGPDDVKVIGSKFINNWTDESGGGVFARYFEDALTVTGSTFSGNAGHGNGGALYAYNDCGECGTVTIDRSTFTANTTDVGGGGAYIDEVDLLRVIGSTFSKNVETDDDGGALQIWDTDTQITGSTFTANSTPGDGGAIWVEDDDYGDNTLVVEKTTITRNSAGGDGGGIYVNDDYDVWLRSVSILGNRALSSGGGLAADYGYATINVDAKSKIDGNSAGYMGGGLYLVGYGWDLYLRGSVSGNSAVGAGGGVAYDHQYDDDDYYVDISAARIERNTAGYAGGGVFVDGDNDGVYVDIHDTLGKVSIAYNKVTQPVDGEGGGLYLYDVYEMNVYTMLDNTARVVISRNQAARGGGLYVWAIDGTYADYGVRFTYNSTYATYDQDCSLWDVDNSTYIGNTPQNQGGC